MHVSVIVPCRNEGAFIDQFIACLKKQTFEDFEIVIADGMSTDDTRAKLALLMGDPQFKIIDNPEIITPCGLNHAIMASSGEIIVRMDVHTWYAPEYINECVKALIGTNAICVGGAWFPKGQTLKQQAIAAAFSSPFGSGGAKSRQPDYNGPVDTVYLGAWRKADLVRLGMFDEHFVRNQDDELALRITRGGGMIWQSSSIRSVYTPRQSLANLFRQFFQYGYWKVPVIRKHRVPSSIRHLIPFVFLSAIVLGLALSLLSPLAGVASFFLLGAYMVASFAAAARCGEPVKMIPRIMASFACLHFGYGLGFAKGIVDFGIISKIQTPKLAPLSR